MADETQNPNIVRPARNKPEPAPEESAPKGIGGTAGWIYILIAILFDLAGIALNLIPAIGQVTIVIVMILAYLFFAVAFLIFSGVNVLSTKYIILFLGSMFIEVMPVADMLPATYGMAAAIVSKSRTNGGAFSLISDIKTLAVSKVTRGKGSAKSSALVQRARRKGGDNLARAAQTRVALRGIKSNLKNRVANEADGFGGNVAKSALNRVTRSRRESPQNKPEPESGAIEQNKVLNLSNRQRDDDFSQAA